MQHEPTGLINIDKPAGVTSHDVVARVRRVAGLRRVGHAGTLDPLATGVLVVALGRATRLIEYVMGAPKAYLTTLRLGQTTDSYDADGTITAERPIAFGDDQLADALAALRGDIWQVPPMHSAIKQGGQPLYKLARQGIEVERAARRVTIDELVLRERTATTLTLHVACSTGTYIRTLVHDLGQALGCGAHVVALRRTRVGDFTAAAAVPLADLTADNVADHLAPLERAVQHLPRLDLDAVQAQAALFGQRIDHAATADAATADAATADAATADAAHGGLARAYDAGGRFLGVLRHAADGWRVEKLFPPA